MEKKYARESRVVKTSRVFPTHTNNHDTLFGGLLMSYIDDIASISAARHSRRECVTASTDSVDFLRPITPDDSVCLESVVSWTGHTSMEVFVKIVAENLRTGERRIAATSFITFVALDDNKKPVAVPQVIPETEEEKKLFATAERRAEARRAHREVSRELASTLTVERSWEKYK
ncbi:acyl-CoA thioesterase [Pullulanibacillus sp. KACC 23026]|uniref:acyl-CoA thioesterase n=1 Tax=Pullulanibacillus sp. KACC 23026 TaxID=3028315 RepID=UPI0023B06FA6|nr:acyl-CoA thioesterase [Pullulanibacillus sp. KACC 23026]WEG13187.1 acyl-CoA thioesterase [Pullulanibacillus sp. KACC 23026]